MIMVTSNSSGRRGSGSGGSRKRSSDIIAQQYGVHIYQ